MFTSGMLPQPHPHAQQTAQLCDRSHLPANLAPGCDIHNIEQPCLSDGNTSQLLVNERASLELHGNFMYYLKYLPRNAVKPSPGCAHEDGAGGCGAASRCRCLARCLTKSRHPTGSIPSSGELCQAPPFICPCNPPTSVGLQVFSTPRTHQTSPISSCSRLMHRTNSGVPSAAAGGTSLHPPRTDEDSAPAPPRELQWAQEISVPADPQRVQPCVLRARIIWRLVCNERMMNVSISRTRKAREISGG